MTFTHFYTHRRAALLLIAVVLLIPMTSHATAPCGDFGECKVLVEVNSSDGDIGFHFLMDGDNLTSAMLIDPNDETIFSYAVGGPLSEQTLTETFAESAEPLCFDPSLDDDDENDDEDFTTLEEFLDRWTDGIYQFAGLDVEDELAEGESTLTFELPAAPADLEYEGGVVSWAPGDDLGECADADELALMVPGMLPVHPEDVVVYEWEIVLEPDVEDDDPSSGKKFTVRIPGDTEELEITIPEDYLASLPENTPAKMEVGAIGVDDNATFSEEDEICLNDSGKMRKGRSPYQWIFLPGQVRERFGSGCDFDED